MRAGFYLRADEIRVIHISIRAEYIGGIVIRFRLKQVIADKEFRAGKRITFEEIAQETGIHRTTLSKISGVRGYNTTTDNIDKLCRYFGCQVGELMEYVPDEEVAGEDR